MGNDILGEIEADAAATAKALPDDEKLRRIGALASRQVALESEIERLEQELSDHKAQLDELRDRTLSDLLLECGLREVKLVNGKRVRVEKLVFASIKGETKAKAILWLEEHRFGSLVRYKVEADIGKGETEKRGKILDALAALGVEARDRADIHPQTLKAFVAEQLSAGADLPRDLFGVFEINRCKIS